MTGIARGSDEMTPLAGEVAAAPTEAGRDVVLFGLPPGGDEERVEASARWAARSPPGVDRS